MDKKKENSQIIIPQLTKPINITKILQKPTLKLSKTKKICTLGPKTFSIQMILKIIDNGANVARLNFSHGTHDSHQKYVHLVNEANKLRSYQHLSILLDTKGPQIRTGNNLDNKQITLVKGSQIQITCDYSYLCTNEKISCSYKDLLNSVKIGGEILFADGKISSVVKRIDHEKNSVFVQVLNNGTMGSKKNMCLPGCEINLPTINDYDEKDILNFGVKHKVDFIAVSFARFKKDIEYIRKIIREKDPDYAQKVQIISKIQNTQALNNIDEIIEASNGIMIARGDLGMETPLEKIVLLQKLITTKCLNAGKYVIVATQMLESMQTKPRPTRAEVSDITNAVLDMADCTMTSGQTANGQFPQQTVNYMNKISLETQKVYDYERLFKHIQSLNIKNKQSSACKLIKETFDNQTEIIMIKTSNIKFINELSTLRPAAYIFVFTNSKEVQSFTAINYGVYCFKQDYWDQHGQFLLKVKEIFGLRAPIKILKYKQNEVLNNPVANINFTFP